MDRRARGTTVLGLSTEPRCPQVKWPRRSSCPFTPALLLRGAALSRKPLGPGASAWRRGLAQGSGQAGAVPPRGAAGSAAASGAPVPLPTVDPAAGRVLVLGDRGVTRQLLWHERCRVRRPRCWAPVTHSLGGRAYDGQFCDQAGMWGSEVLLRPSADGLENPCGLPALNLWPQDRKPVRQRERLCDHALLVCGPSSCVVSEPITGGRIALSCTLWTTWVNCMVSCRPLVGSMQTRRANSCRIHWGLSPG